MKIYRFPFASLSGIDNMALDEALLEAARHLDTPIFRFYAWKEPTVSLGYFQRLADRKRHPASIDCAVVRRLSGGGAIVHDLELTYCLAVPPGHILANEHRLKLYETVHRAAIGVLADWGIEAFLAGDRREWPERVKNVPVSDKELFLCFQRIAPGDVVVESKLFGLVKILGSAQYRDRFGAVLQHGSLLCERSPAAPELPGLHEIGGETNAWDSRRDARHEENLSASQFMEQWAAKMAECWHTQWQVLDEEERKAWEPHIAIIRKKRYADGWIGKK